jgi:hypothetical protein
VLTLPTAYELRVISPAWRRPSCRDDGARTNGSTAFCRAIPFRRSWG